MKKRLPKIKSSIIDNGAYKLVAFLVAIVIWVTLVSSRKDVVLNKQLNVDFLARSSVKVEMDRGSKLLSIKLAGPRNLLRKYNESTYRLSVDVTNFETGDYSLEVNQRLLNLPIGIKLLRAKPTNLKFLLSPEDGLEEEIIEE